VGLLVVARPLDEYNRDLADTRNKLVATAALLLLVTVAVGVAIGYTSVTRPLFALIEAMRLAHRGDSTTRVVAAHDDEVGLVAREFNAMMDDLNQVRKSLIEEGERRVRMEASLRQLDRLVTIGELAAGLAHEIGSPLQVLNGRARLLESRPDDAAEVKRHAGILVEQTERVSRIVERMLRFGRRVPPRLAPCNLVTLVRATLDLVETDAKKRGVSVAFHADDPQVVTLGDEDQLQQVSLNLVLNALDATPPDGRIEVRVELAEDTVALVVSDTGRGIADEALPHIFDAFFTTRAEAGGTGLGLAVVKTIVNEHHGRVTARSERGAGTTFRVELPRHHGGGMA
jgi:signal transduction histidine kinase